MRLINSVAIKNAGPTRISASQGRGIGGGGGGECQGRGTHIVSESGSTPKTDQHD